MWLFLSAVGLGFAFCALPGAVTAQAVRRGLEQGFRASLSLQLGALVGVALWAILALIGIALLAQQIVIRLLLSAAGMLLLLWLMWQALRAAARGTAGNTAGDAKATKIRGNVTLGAALSLANPGALAFWLGIGSAVIAPGAASLDLRDPLVFLAGFLFGAALWCFLLAGVLAWGRRFITPQFFRLVNLICGLALGFFALKLLWGTIMLWQQL